MRCINADEYGSIKDFCQKTVMRSKKEILDKADLVYRMDWAAVDARCHGMTGPAGINHGVIQERHKALNWMIWLHGRGMGQGGHPYIGEMTERFCFASG